MSSLIKRVRDITVATLNERLERAEDPVRLIDQFLWATREEIIQAERLYQQYTAHANSLRAQWLQAEQQAEKREQQAITALKAGEEHLARLALTEKQHHAQRAQQYKELYETSQANVTRTRGTAAGAAQRIPGGLRQARILSGAHGIASFAAAHERAVRAAGRPSGDHVPPARRQDHRHGTRSAQPARTPPVRAVLHSDGFSGASRGRAAATETQAGERRLIP